MYQSLRVVRKPQVFSQLQRSYAIVKEPTYYEILEIPQTASKNDIRMAFLKLSKERHPDKNNKADKNSHAEFVKINEAYSILSKDHSRKQYDVELKYSAHTYPYYQPPSDNAYYKHTSGHYYTWYDMQMERNRMRYQQHQNFNNNVKITNVHLVLFCVFLCIFGTSLQILAVARSPTFNRSELLEKSKRYAAEYAAIRQRAMEHTNEENIQHFYECVIGDKDK